MGFVRVQLILMVFTEGDPSVEVLVFKGPSIYNAIFAMKKKS